MVDLMADRFGYDACLKINNVYHFAEAIGANPVLAGKNCAGEFVSFVDTKERTEFRRSDPFEKERKFEWQKEFKIIWDGKAPEHGSIISVPAILPFIERVY